MNWREEKIDHEDAVPDFLRRHLRLPGTTNTPDVVCNFGRDFTIHSQFLNMHGTINEQDGSISLIGCHAEKGHYFGAMGMKSLLAMAAGRGCNQIFLEMVREDGRSFWPYHGSLPILGSAYSTLRYHDFFARHDADLSLDARKEVKSIQAVATQSVLKAWRLMSQCDARLNNGQPINGAKNTEDFSNALAMLAAPNIPTLPSDYRGRTPANLSHIHL